MFSDTRHRTIEQSLFTSLFSVFSVFFRVNKTCRHHSSVDNSYRCRRHIYPSLTIPFRGNHLVNYIVMKTIQWRSTRYPTPSMDDWQRFRCIGDDMADTVDCVCWSSSRQYSETIELREMTGKVAIMSFRTLVINHP